VSYLRAGARAEILNAGVAWHFTSGEIPGTQWRIVLAIPDSVLLAAVSGAGQYVPWLLLSMFALCGLVVLGLVVRARRDAQRLALAYRKLELRNAQANEANEAKSRFLAGMSHELRTPLNGIIGFAELMYDGRVGPVCEEHREFLADILSSARHLLALINDVLDISKVEAGKLEFRATRVDIGELVCGVVSSLRPLAEERRILVTTDIDPRLGEMWLDAGKYRQVLFNYLSNAIKFTPEGGCVRIRLLRPADRDLIQLEVEDNGIGIPAEDIPTLFTEFGMLRKGPGASVPGTGLGLALTKRLVEAQGGSVAVRSQPGRGSTFLATIRCQEPADDDAQAADPGPAAALASK
jgi:signal transduction histidine kinase